MKAIKQNDVIDVIYDSIYGYSLEEAFKILEDHRKGVYIPIEWIDGYIKRRANDVNIYAEILFISDMVKKWEEENGKDSE